MARSTATSLVVLFGCMSGCGATTAPSAQRPLILERAPTAEEFGEAGWTLSGNAHDLYAVHRDTVDARTSWLLEPVADTFGKYGTWMRHVDAAEYRGKRVLIRATIKTRETTRRADLWARAQAKDSPSDGSGLAGDSKKLPPNLDWTAQALVLDVPNDAAWLEYGVGVAGPGKLWLDDAKLEVVGDVPRANAKTSKSGAARFSPSHWGPTGDDVEEYAIEADANVKHGGRASGSLFAIVPKPKGFASLAQWVEGAYRGKRVRFSAYVKADDVAGWAGLWMRVDEPGSGHKSSAFDNMENRAIRGTVDWTRYEIVLDVAPDAPDIAFGVLLSGAGHVWIDDVTFEIVDASVPTTNTLGGAAAGAKTTPSQPKNLDFEE